MIDINLIAARRAQRQRSIAIMRLAFWCLFGLALVIVLLYAWMTIQIRLVNGSIAEVQATLQAPEMQEQISHVAFLDEEISILNPKVRILENVHESESRWIEVLADLGRLAPANVGVNSLASRKADADHLISLKGQADSQHLVGAYMLALQDSGWCKELQLNQTAADRQPKDANTLRKINYEITIPLIKPIGLNIPKEETDKNANPAPPVEEGVS